MDAVYELVINVDVRRSTSYDDPGKSRMRRLLYRILDEAFAAAAVPAGSVHREDRGDGILAAVAGSVPPARVLGLWVTELHEQLRRENPGLRVPLGLRVGLNVGPVTHDPMGICGRAVDLACRLADSPPARRLLDRERADLVVAASEPLYQDVVRHGGRFIEPADYLPAPVRLKELDTRGWFLLPGRAKPAPLAADAEGPADAAPGPVGAAEPAPAPTPTPTRAAQVTVHGDHNESHGNTYLAPVHIGRTTPDAPNGGPRRA
ncbi:hypothetical protein GCM10009738_02310 [Kitasatospora viridis]